MAIYWVDAFHHHYQIQVRPAGWLRPFPSPTRLPIEGWPIRPKQPDLIETVEGCDEESDDLTEDAL